MLYWITRAVEYIVPRLLFDSTGTRNEQLSVRWEFLLA